MFTLKMPQNLHDCEYLYKKDQQVSAAAERHAWCAASHPSHCI